MNNELRVTSHKSQGTNKAFTLIELVVAVAILAMVLSFAGVIFKVSIGAYRTATANTEIMQKLRAITDQLNADFKGLQKDGYLILHSEVQADRREYEYSGKSNFRADRLYYFCAGDFQSWFDSNIRSNIARVYFGHDSISLDLPLERYFNPPLDKPVSKWNLARDVVLLTPRIPVPPLPAVVDYNNISYAERKANIPLTLNSAGELLFSSVPIDIRIDPNGVRRLMCQNAGEIIIQWADGTTYPEPDNSLAWFGFSMPYGDPYNLDIEFIPEPPTYYTAFWTPTTQQQYWPKALKFTFTLYDSKGVIENARTFTHIVYIGD